MANDWSAKRYALGAMYLSAMNMLILIGWAQGYPPVPGTNTADALAAMLIGFLAIFVYPWFDHAKDRVTKWVKG